MGVFNPFSYKLFECNRGQQIADGDPLVAVELARNQRDPAFRDAASLGDKCQHGSVRLALHRRCIDAQFQRPVVLASELGLFRPGLYV